MLQTIWQYTKQSLADYERTLMSRLERLQQEALFEAIVDAAALVALADGRLEPSELAAVERFARTTPGLAVFGAERALERLYATIDALRREPTTARAAILERIGNQRGIPEHARAIVDACALIGEADEDFSEAEKTVVRELCRHLGLDPLEIGLSTRYAVIVNARSGTVLRADRDLPERIRDGFRRSGVLADVRFAQGEEIGRAIAAALDDATNDAIVVGGGDGTIVSAAARVRDTPKPLGMLPLGTVNQLTKDLAIPQDLDGAIDAIAVGQPRPVDLAEVNGHVFLCASMLGLFPKLAKHRERARGASGVSATRYLLSQGLRELMRCRPYEVTLDTGDGPRTVHTSAYMITNNPYDDRSLTMPGRATLDGGKLGIYIAHYRTRLGVLWFMLRVATGHLRHDGLLEVSTAESVRVNSKRARLRLINDGELMKLVPPLQYRIHPRALVCLTPTQAPQFAPDQQDR